MKHHFADFLDRSGDYWTIIPNIERFSYSSDSVIAQKEAVKALTISKGHKNWKQVFDCPNLEELTLHEASKEQVLAISKLSHLKRLRVTFLRTADITFIGELQNLEELILEYVSGFSDLAPLLKLKNLKSVHFENLRKVSNFDGLKALNSLKFLRIDGTLDWNQPIENFEFLKGLQNLEVFSLGFIINKTDFPALLPIVHLKKLKKIHIGRTTFKTNEYAFLEAVLPNVEGCNWELYWEYDNKLNFLGKGAGYIGKNNPNVNNRCEEFGNLFEIMKEQSRKIIKSYIK